MIDPTKTPYIRKPKFTTRVVNFFSQSKGLAIRLITIILVLTAFTIVLLIHTINIRFQRDLGRLILKDRLDILDSARLSVATSEQALREVENTPEPPHNRPYLVLSIKENRLWYKKEGAVLFTAPVATGSGKTLVKEGNGTWKFETPRGRLVVQSKDENPVWVPPDWHYVEQSHKRKLDLVHLEPGQTISAADGSIIKVADDNVIRSYPDGREEIMEATDDHEIVVDDKLIAPPLGSSQRRYKGVLGDYRLNLGGGYAMHGTNKPDSVGRAVSHGCIRLLNEDMKKLYPMVPVGTPVYIY